MSFRDTLTASVKTDASAYMQYISGKDREGFASYAFVEDDDDMAFYQHAAPHVEGICYLSCGGKENVLKVYRKLVSSIGVDGLLFFIDRDTEEEPFEGDPDIFRTEFYSWESYVCQKDAVTKIVDRRFRPSLDAKERKEILVGWQKTIDNFAVPIKWHVSLAHVSKQTGVSLGTREVALARNCHKDGNQLYPADEVEIDLQAKHDAALRYEVQVELLSEKRAVYENADPLRVGRGKNVFQILKAFLASVESRTQKKFFGDYGSALAILLCLPNDLALFEKIRSYYNKRLGIVN